MASYGAVTLANLLLNIAVGRSLGAGALAAFALATAVARVFYSGTDFGLAHHLTRLLARDHAATDVFANLFLTFRLLLIPIGAAFSVAFALVLNEPDLWTFVGVALAQGMLTIHGLYGSVFLSRDRQTAIASIHTAGAGLVVIAAGAWFLASRTLTELAFVYFLATALTAYLWSFEAKRQLGYVARPSFRFGQLTPELRHSAAIGLSLLLATFVLKLPLFVLSIFATETETGAFVAADMFVTASGILQAAITSATYPRLSRNYGSSPATFQRIYWTANAALAGLGLLGAAFLALWGAEIGELLFPSKDFGKISDLLPIMAWSVPAFLLVHHNILVFASANMEKANLRLMVAWIVVSAIFQVSLVPEHGALGAAWALLLSRAAGLALVSVVAFMGKIHLGRPLNS